MFDRVFLVVLDSCGIGNAPDAKDFGDEGAHTLRSVMSAHPKLTNLASLGLFNIPEAELEEYAVGKPLGSYCALEEMSRGKDTTVGHWEIAGLVSEKPFPTYKNGFPKEIIDEFCKENNCNILCNRPYSGTEVIKDYGEEHIRTKSPIVYTSADSVFQIACHEDVIPVEKLYKMCESARKILKGEHAVGRVIARPFAGKAPDFYRTGGRHDYSLPPFDKTMLDLIKEKNMDVISVGKINDIFASKGVTESNPTKHNDEGEKLMLELQKRDFRGLCFVNLVDFDMLYGHRNDIAGYAKALEEFDGVLSEFMKNMRENDLLMITADHGCDPGYKGTDHTRERVPLLIYGRNAKASALGLSKGYSCIAKTVCENFNIENNYFGKSFFKSLLK